MGDYEHEALRILTSPGRYIDGNIVVFGGFGAPVPDPCSEGESTQVRATEILKCLCNMRDGCLKILKFSFNAPLDLSLTCKFTGNSTGRYHLPQACT